jgi:hypothetical protein
VYNIQKAVSRLDYSPKLKEIEVTDFKKGLGTFTPKPDRPVSFAALKETLKKAGYTLAAAEITVSGELGKDERGWILIVPSSGQKFVMVGPQADQVATQLGSVIEVTGDWKSTGTGSAAHETIAPRVERSAFKQTELPFFVKANYKEPTANPLLPEAPIRVTSPGLTVYKGGAVTPRFYLIKQRLGSLEVTRQVVDVSLSYTPTPHLQLEIEVPFSRTSFETNNVSSSGSGPGNITAWAKYRFFRKVKTYGDRQAAFRAGLELPTGKKTPPSSSQGLPAFVRQQLTPINGGLAPHFDLAFSQAGGRFIFGGNAQAIFRTERDGFRMGHEQRLNTDLEYVIPRDPQKPGGELFIILETTFIHRSAGRLNGLAVSGSKATEYFLAPGLQYAAHPQFVIEGSYQFPVVRNIGPNVLRTDRNILIGARYLF